MRLIAGGLPAAARDRRLDHDLVRRWDPGVAGHHLQSVPSSSQEIALASVLASVRAADRNGQSGSG